MEHCGQMLLASLRLEKLGFMAAMVQSSPVIKDQLGIYFKATNRSYLLSILR